jgi:hypothetical protein
LIPLSKLCDFLTLLYLKLYSSLTLSSRITSLTTFNFFISIPVYEEGRLTTSSPLSRPSRRIGDFGSSEATLKSDFPFNF